LDRDLIATLRLIRTPGIGPVTCRQLLARFGSAEAAIDAVPELARRGGGKPPVIATVAAVEREMAQVEKLGARYLLSSKGLYPSLLDAVDGAPSALIVKGDLTGKLAKEVLPKMFETGDSAATVVEREGLKTISDTGELERMIDAIIAANPKQAEQYKAGRTALMGFFVGQVMKSSRGQANPAVVNDLVAAKLA